VSGSARLSYGTTQLGLSRNVILNGVLISAIVLFVALPGFAALSDRLGRRPVYLAGAIAMGLLAFPFWWLVDSRQPILIVLALILGMISMAAMYGPQAAFFSELFGARVRYTGASLGYQVAAVLGGGLSPFIATQLLVEFGGASWPIAVYMLALAAISIISVSLAKETHHADIGAEPVPQPVSARREAAPSGALS
jgi:MFS transporter, MHS family, shikimate and dehydroshikimate transport protein